MEPFCSNEKCMFHNVDVPKDQWHLELESDLDTPIILSDAHHNQRVERVALTLNGKCAMKYCTTCQEAVSGFLKLQGITM